ncbi:MAG: Gfo/Idh/MocA family oxidoreductase [Acidimicrobiales bacterium]|nr:Gfo/Idh/MocA family oxidoreductase [Acidimicrobiales bacterium]
MSQRRRLNEAVRVAVVGVGGMGSNHARVLASMKGVELVAVVDPDLERARRVADAYQCRAIGSVEDLPDVDAVCVAAPSSLHCDIAVPLLLNGIDCLIEKPLATTAEDCQALIGASKTGGGQILVGHIERFNPAVRELQSIVDPADILSISARRMSAVSGRILDVDVVLDLMVHDIDIVLGVARVPIVETAARGIDGPRGADHVVALLTLASGGLASLTASRITQNKIRHLEVTTKEQFFVIDYPSQELHIFRQGRIATSGSIDERYTLDVNTEKVLVRRVEPLAEELSHFIRVVRGEQAPAITGEDAFQALKTVWAIQSQVAAKRMQPA